MLLFCGLSFPGTATQSVSFVYPCIHPWHRAEKVSFQFETIALSFYFLCFSCSLLSFGSLLCEKLTFSRSVTESIDSDPLWCVTTYTACDYGARLNCYSLL